MRVHYKLALGALKISACLSGGADSQSMALGVLILLVTPVSRPFSLLLALVALICAFSGIWLGGLRNELAIKQALSTFPRPNDVPFYRCADSFYWVSYAREMMEQKTARVRFTKIDNAPYGRPNYGWASLNAWYLVGLAAVWSLTSGMT